MSQERQILSDYFRNYYVMSCAKQLSAAPNTSTRAGIHHCSTRVFLRLGKRFTSPQCSSRNPCLQNPRTQERLFTDVYQKETELSTSGKGYRLTHGSSRSSGSLQHVAQATQVTEKISQQMAAFSIWHESNPTGSYLELHKFILKLTAQPLPSLIRLHYDKNILPESTC